MLYMSFTSSHANQLQCQMHFHPHWMEFQNHSKEVLEYAMTTLFLQDVIAML